MRDRRAHRHQILRAIALAAVIFTPRHFVRSYWLSVCAAVGLALLSGSVDAQPVGGNAGNQPSAQPSQAQPAPNPQPIFPPAVQDAIERAASALEAANNHPEAAQEAQRAKEDLEAQKSMAFWATLLFFAALLESIITGTGVWLVWRTLIAARDSAREAKRAADAAEAALAASDRPHIIAEDIAIGAIEDGPEEEKNVGFGIHLRNYGEDLAFLKRYGLVFQIITVGDHIPAQVDIPTGAMYWPLPPGRGWEVKASEKDLTITVSEQHRAAINNGTAKLFAFGTAIYADVTKRDHVSRFLYVFRLIDRKFIPFADEHHWEYT